MGGLGAFLSLLSQSNDTLNCLHMLTGVKQFVDDNIGGINGTAEVVGQQTRHTDASTIQSINSDNMIFGWDL